MLIFPLTILTAVWRIKVFLIHTMVYIPCFQNVYLGITSSRRKITRLQYNPKFTIPIVTTSNHSFLHV